MDSDKPTRQNRVRDALGKLYDQQPPYFREYLRRFREDPTSRVFAPLAEAYRRLGRVDEAIAICREGLEHHPEFHGGRVALAKCLLEKKSFDEAIEQLEKVVRAVPENLLAQRILGDAYLGRNRPDQALHCFKMALLLSPSDVALAERVHDLEKKLNAEPAPPAEAAAPAAVEIPAPPAAPVEEEPLFGEMPAAPIEATPLPEPPGTGTMEPSISFPAPSDQEFHEREDYGALWTDEEIEETGHTSFVEVGVASDVVEEDKPSLQEMDEVSQITELPADMAPTPPEVPDDDGLMLGEDDEENDEAYQVEHVSAVFGDDPGKAGEITTETLGDLYFSQGQFEKALKIFEKLYSAGRSVELERKIQGCRVKLGVDEAALNRNRKIASLRRVLNRVKSGVDS